MWLNPLNNILFNLFDRISNKKQIEANNTNLTQGYHGMLPDGLDASKNAIGWLGSKSCSRHIPQVSSSNCRATRHSMAFSQALIAEL